MNRVSFIIRHIIAFALLLSSACFTNDAVFLLMISIAFAVEISTIFIDIDE